MKIITFEGHDNSGKSTLANMLSKETGYELVKFPNDDIDSGKRIARMLKGIDPFDPEYFQELQNENKQERIKNIGTGTYIFDRYKLSEIVYGLANEIPRTLIMCLADGLPDPDVTFILVGKSYGQDSDIYGKEDYQERIKELYKQEGKNACGNVFYISNERTISEVFGEIKGILERCFL
jgi:thymidylate kinase